MVKYRWNQHMKPLVRMVSPRSPGWPAGKWAVYPPLYMSGETTVYATTLSAAMDLAYARCTGNQEKQA